MNIEKFAKEVVATNYVKSGGDRQSALDPTTILQWISVIRELIPLIAECRDAFALKENAQKGVTVSQRAILNWHTRRVLGAREFRRHGRETVLALINSVKESSVEDIQALYDEV